MSYAAAHLRGNLRRVMTAQALIILAVAGASMLIGGREAARAAAFGGLITMFNSILLSRRIELLGNAPTGDVKRGLLIFLAGAVQRFVLTLGLFAVGLGPLGLQPLPLLLAFGVAHIGYTFSGRAPQAPPA